MRTHSRAHALLFFVTIGLTAQVSADSLPHPRSPELGPGDRLNALLERTRREQEKLVTLQADFVQLKESAMLILLVLPLLKICDKRIVLYLPPFTPHRFRRIRCRSACLKFANRVQWDPESRSTVQTCGSVYCPQFAPFDPRNNFRRIDTKAFRVLRWREVQGGHGVTTSPLAHCRSSFSTVSGSKRRRSPALRCGTRPASASIFSHF